MRSGIALLIVGAAFWTPVANAQEAHSHPPPEKLGTVTFATSCVPEVSRDFQRAVALLHSFAYSAAEKAFSDVAAADPSCAMAHWGIAMSYYHQLWSPPGPGELNKGQTQVEQAGRLHVRTARERQFIAAIAAYYRDYDHLKHPVRAKAYEDAMSAAAKSNPNDTEVQVFYALSLLATAPPEDKTHANQKRASLILEPIYRKYPDHPGVAHYLIHDYDSAELAARGLGPARAYSKIAPSAPHALHMPSHIFTRLGLWDDSIASNIAARAAAHSQGDVGEELHAMDYLVYAYLQRGRQADAEEVVAALGSMQGLSGSDFKVGYAATVMPIRLAVERGNWETAATLRPLPESAPHIAALVYWARAVANSRAGRPDAASDDIARLEACKQQLQDEGNRYWSTQVEVLGTEARAWQESGRSRADEAVRLLRQAADEEDAVEKLPLTPGPIVPAREQLGELLLTMNRSKEALQEFRTALIAAPGRRGALAGAAKAAESAGDTQTARRLRAGLAT
jgi:tetratricopeptide (TPR) repeat protein